jgi:hypothetical protein
VWCSSVQPPERPLGRILQRSPSEVLEREGREGVKGDEGNGEKRKGE